MQDTVVNKKGRSCACPSHAGNIMLMENVAHAGLHAPSAMLDTDSPFSPVEDRNMARNALLVYPEFPTSYWSMRYALEFVGKKSNMPPLGLLTVAALFPDDYNLRVVDMNVQELTDADLDWADFVFMSAMMIQRRSLDEVVERCKLRQIPTIAGGPFPTSYHEDLDHVDYIIRGEVEETFPDFLRELEAGTAQHMYEAPPKPAVTVTPTPRYDLIPIHLRP